MGKWKQMRKQAKKSDMALVPMIAAAGLREMRREQPKNREPKNAIKLEKTNSYPDWARTTINLQSHKIYKTCPVRGELSILILILTFHVRLLGDNLLEATQARSFSAF
jgi:hypothetical protein